MELFNAVFLSIKIKKKASYSNTYALLFYLMGHVNPFMVKNGYISLQ
jgi:hypothetical protein